MAGSVAYPGLFVTVCAPDGVLDAGWSGMTGVCVCLCVRAFVRVCVCIRERKRESERERARERRGGGKKDAYLASSAHN